jgi:hypothetical protein
MAAIVYGVPYIPPVAPTFEKAPLVSTWTGWDGSEWVLTDHASGVFLMPGVRGLGDGPHDQFKDTAPGLAGSLFAGWRAVERPAFWPVAIFEDSSSEAWILRDRAFRRTLRPGTTGVWTVVSKPGTTRRLTCRYVSGLDAAGIDPVQAGWITYGVNLVADVDPFWRGEPVERKWGSTAPVDFFDPDGDPMFNISDGRTVDAAEMTNPGDVDAWPVWVVNGPVTSVDLEVGGSVIEAHFTVADGERLVIDTNPTEQIAYLGDVDPDDPFGVLSPVDVTEDLGSVDFAPMPADATTALSLDMTGTGSVAVRIVPGYWAAW